MNIKNYTSTVPVDRSISNIERVLALYGAQQIMKDYKDGKPVAITFGIKEEGRTIPIHLPAKTEEIEAYLMLNIRRPRQSTELKVKEQAERTAWKILSDWVEIQMSLIAIKQRKFLECFLSYVWDGKQTFYERVMQNPKVLMLTDK